jgi:hypothetical protein
MKVIPTRIHGVLDYLVGATLIALPLILGWNYPENTMMTILGSATIVASLFTAYELGLVKVIPMAVHLMFDTFVALFLIIAPFAYANIDTVPGYIMMGLGITELLAVVLSQSTPSRAALHAMPGGYEDRGQKAA